MKRLLLIAGLFVSFSTGLFAQEEEEANEKIRDKMSEYIQKRLDMTDAEAKKFTPVFIEYFKEWRQTLRLHKDDKLIRQQKIVDLRLRFRTQFRDIIGEKRGNQVFNQQDRFIQELRDIRRERMRNSPRRGG